MYIYKQIAVYPRTRTDQSKVIATTSNLQPTVASLKTLLRILTIFSLLFLALLYIHI